MRFRDLARRYSPQPAINLATRLFGSLHGKESLGLIRPPWLAYSLLTAARIAERTGVGSFWVVEFWGCVWSRPKTADSYVGGRFQGDRYANSCGRI